jgi:hypothetical protein
MSIIIKQKQKGCQQPQCAIERTLATADLSVGSGTGNSRASNNKQKKGHHQQQMYQKHHRQAILEGTQATKWM